MTDSTSLSALELAEDDATRALLDVLDVPEPQFRSVHEDIRALMVDALVSAVEARVRAEVQEERSAMRIYP